MKALRIKHYGYVLATGLLFVSCLVVVFVNLRTASADVSSISITSPSSSQKIFQGDQTIKGTAPALKKLSVFDGEKKVGETTSGVDGKWSLSWAKVRPGQHNLKAYLVDGTGYSPKPFSTNSVESTGLNDGQVKANFPAGVTTTSGLVYESTNNKSFVLNKANHSVSVFDMSNNNYDDTIEYASQEALAPTDKDSSLCRCKNFDYVYDKQNKKIYILDLERIYVISTQDNSVLRTTAVNLLDTPMSQGEPNRFKLYLDPQGQYVYLYVSNDLSNENQLIQRYSTSSGQKDENWSQTGRRLVSTSGDDVYIVKREYTPEENSAKSLLYKYDASGGQTSVVDLSSVCSEANIYSSLNLAVSSDGGTVYAACKVDQWHEGALAISVTTGQVTNLSLEIGPSYTWLTTGNLTANRLSLLSDNGTENKIKSLDTSTGTFLPDLTINSSQTGGNWDYEGKLIEKSFIAGPNGQYSYMTDNETDVFVVSVSGENNQITSTHSYSKADLGFFQINHRGEYVGGSKIAILPLISQNKIQILDTSSGEFSQLKYGLGGGARLYASSFSSRLFSISDLAFVSDDAMLYSGRITVSNLQTGQYESDIELGSATLVLGGVVDRNGTYFYVAHTSLYTGQVLVSKINTQTLNVERVYSSVGQITQSGFPFYRLELANNELVISNDSADVKFLNLQNDTSRTLTLDSNPVGAFSILGAVITNHSGDKIAVRTANSPNEISIINVSNLETINTISVGKTDSTVTSMSFTQDDRIAVGYLKIGSVLRVYNLDGILEKESQVYLDRNYSRACFPLKITNYSTEEEYLFVEEYCIPFDNGQDEAGLYTKNLEVYDLQSLNKIHTLKQLDSEADVNSLTNYMLILGIGNSPLVPEVKTASQTVDVVADSVEITSPVAGTKLSKGQHKIKGTAPPGKTVTITVNGSSIGTVVSDEYGLWEKTHNFSITGTYDIKASIVQPGYSRAYMTHMSATDFNYSTAVINMSDGSTEDTIDAIAGSVPTMTLFNRDKTRLYVLSMNISDESLSLQTYNTDNNLLISTLPIDLGQDELSFVNSVFLSSDGASFYFQNNRTDHPELVKVSLASGAVQERVYLGQDYQDDLSQNGNSGSGLFGLQAFAKDTNIVYLPYYRSRNSIVAVNLSSGQVESIDLPDNTLVAALEYDEQNHSLYVMSVIDGVVDGEKTITAYSTDDGSVKWSTSLSDYSDVYFALFQSRTSNELYFMANDSSGNNQGVVSIPSINSLTGQITDHSFNMSENGLGGAATILNGPSEYKLVSMDESQDGKHLYFTVFNFIAFQQGDIANGSVLAQYNKSENKLDSVVKNTTADFYFRFSNNSFANQIPDSEDNDTVSVSVNGATVPNECDPATDAACKPTVKCTVNCEPKPPIECNVKTECPINDIKKQLPDSIKALVSSKAVQPEISVKTINPVQLFSANVLAAIKRFAISVPLPIINIFPYLLFLLLLGLIGYYLYQTQKQLRREDRLRDIYEKQKVLAEEKRNFLELASHYLRTPLTYIKAGSEIILRNKQNEAAATELSESVGHLSLFVESLVEEASTNDQIEAIEPPDRKVWSPLLTKSFILPVIGFAAALGVFYLIFGVIGGFNFGPAKYITQLLIMFVVIQLFYGMFKNHQKILDEEEVITKTLNSEAALDHTRSKLMKDAGEQLQTRTAHLKSVINKLQSADTSKAIMQQGVDRLSELSGAFALVGKLESEVMLGSVEQVSVRTMAADIIQPMVDKFREKKVKVEVSGFDNDIMLTTNKPLAELTLKTLLSNALGASKEGSSLVVKCLHRDGRVAFQVIDHGEGIPKDKIDRLFKPFVRVGPVTTFNREGIGLSLYLDRLIMHSLGGEVEIVSRFKHGTTATAIFNQKKIA